ncbi:hypothetical protein QTO34_016843 [Cnephaeus nilssonii]|uniref:Murine leukemia virus integrase C-terminal domain-containing protein n=1 Tax=Cnephaeus nilssonii TaxID=3371016 RepID=A0AA40LQP0_CNENI|nr:hypothetical protein QTO34_016843 [Eptesicus nilssonii]
MEVARGAHRCPFSLKEFRARILEALQSTQRAVQKHVHDALPIPTSDLVHPFHPGDSVWVKKFTTQGLTPTWKGPYIVILTTPTAVKIDEIPMWLHHTQLKAAQAE